MSGRLQAWLQRGRLWWLGNRLSDLRYLVWRIRKRREVEADALVVNGWITHSNMEAYYAFVYDPQKSRNNPSTQSSHPESEAA